MTVDIVEFLRARLDEDERDALAEWGTPQWNEYDPETYNSPARVLREVEAKRRIVEHMEIQGRAALTLRTLASVHADHPDYQPEWKP